MVKPLVSLETQTVIPEDLYDDTDDEFQAVLAQRQLISEWLWNDIANHAKEKVCLVMQIKEFVQKVLDQRESIHYM
eukprot:11269812-Karenia_brevis.AAC.1